MPALTRPRSHELKTSRLCLNEGGFTLLELLVVVAIISLLAAIAIPAYNNYINKAKITVAIGTLDTIRKNFETYHIDYQEYPPEPINFVTGMDGANRTVFAGELRNQINQDTTPVSYVRDNINSSYTLVVNARDSSQTVLTLTPTDIAKAP